ncbi:MAG: type II secretion system protein N [Mariprofundaceae bacterium]|nr:type II secretion system protein N [Mariprofundaceae bacterium]
MMNKTSGRFSWWILLAVFGIGLCVFIAIRWDMTAYLRHKLDHALEQQHLDLTYASLQRHGLQISLHQVQFNDSHLPQALQLDDVDISPDLFALLHGNLAAQLHIQNNFMDIQTLMTFHQQTLAIQNLDASGDVAHIQTWLALPSPAHAQGQLHLEGSFNMDMNQGIPLAADLTAHWQMAGIQMMSQAYPLGDYSLKATMLEKTIQWTLMGGKALLVQGKGSIQGAESPLLQWILKGDVQLQALPTSPLSNFLTSTQRHIKLSGSIGHPQWQF